MTEELKPCRGCGHTPDYSFGADEAKAYCLSCGVEFFERSDDGTDPKIALIQKWNEWNTRPTIGLWQPIETAPKDGTKVDLWDGEIRWTNCFYKMGVWFQKRGWPVTDCTVGVCTHWTPCPSPPKDEATE